MNIQEVKDYMLKMNNEKFDDLIDFKNVSLKPSSDDGIIVDLEDGKHTLRVGRKVSNHQMNRALVLILIDSVMDVKSEDERKNLGDKSYTEYGGKVSQLQEQFFPPEEVFVEKEGAIIKDSLVDCDASMCRLKNTGSVDRDKIIGLKYNEIKLVNK